MEALLRDFRLAARVLMRRPLVSGLAALSLALGIGANTTIFSMVNALFLRALPVHDADTLVAVATTDKKNPGNSPLSHLNWKDLREQNDTFESLAAYDWIPLSVATGGESTLSFGQLVSGNYFDTLGVAPAHGRLFGPNDDATPGGHPIVVLNHSFWSRRFAGQLTAIGQKVVINATPFEVVGVAPPGFTGATVGVQPDLWVPMAMNGQLRQSNNWYETRRGLFLLGIARLKAGVDLATAQAAVTTIGTRLAEEYPDDNEGRSFALTPFRESTFPGPREAAVAGTSMLMVIVGFVLLIACANVANLLLARATSRRREIAVRLALGAGRWTLIRQLLSESLLLALVGAGFGLLLAHWAGRAVLGFLPSLQIPITLNLDLGLDPLVLLFTFCVAVLTGIISGLAPAWQMAKPELVGALKERGAAEMRGNRLFSARNALVGVQVGLSLVALVGAGLFVQSLAAAQKTDPGFEAERLGLVSFDISLQGYDEERGLVFLQSIRERVEAVPGVSGLSLAKAGPLAGTMMRSVFPEGAEGDRGVLIQVNGVTDGYFETLGIPVLRGRTFDATDRKGSVPVVIVNETMAAKFWPDQDALGKRFRFFGEDDMVEVVGVARDAKYNTLGEDPQSYIYRPLEQDYAGAVTLIASTDGEPAGILLPIQRELKELNREMPLVGISTVGQVLTNSLWASRLGASLLALFGGLALILATVGIYGVMSYVVSQRAQEIGVRMTLGADRGTVMRMVFRQGMLVVVAGLVLGLVLAAAATRVIGNLLFVSASDPLVYIVMSLTLAAVGALANLFPALRATAVDPLIALRSE